MTVLRIVLNRLSGKYLLLYVLYQSLDLIKVLMRGEVMKSLVRWSATLGLVGSTLLGSVLSVNIPALALTQDQIKQKLDGIPVFIITNNQGLPLSRPLPQAQNGQKAGSVTGVYMSRQDAEGFISQLQNLKDKDPKMLQLVKSLQVTPVPLGVIYQQLEQTKSQPNHLVFAFKPVDKDVQGAVQLTGQPANQFTSVPIFAVRFAPNKGYVPIKLPSNNQEILPLFMSKQDADGLLTQVKQKFPQADIQVINIDAIIRTFQEKNDKWLDEVFFVPSPESRQFIKSLPQNSNTQSPSGKK